MKPTTAPKNSPITRLFEARRIIRALEKELAVEKAKNKELKEKAK